MSENEKIADIQKLDDYMCLVRETLKTQFIEINEKENISEAFMYFSFDEELMFVNGEKEEDPAIEITPSLYFIRGGWITLHYPPINSNSELATAIQTGMSLMGESFITAVTPAFVISDKSGVLFECNSPSLNLNKRPNGDMYFVLTARWYQ